MLDFTQKLSKADLKVTYFALLRKKNSGVSKGLRSGRYFVDPF